MPDFGKVEQTPINPMLDYMASQRNSLVVDTGRQDLADRALLRDQAGGFASADPAEQARASGVALSVPGVGGNLSAAGVGTMHADQRLGLDHALSVGAGLAQAILMEPPEKRDAKYRAFLPIMKQAGMAYAPDFYPGDDRIVALRDAGFSAEKRLEYLSKIPVYGETGTPHDAFEHRGQTPTPASAGAGTVDEYDQMLWGNESRGAATAPTSVNGARGGHQIMPATFAQYARPGESIDNPADNAAVGKRIVADLKARFGDDPARIAVGYFSGPDNVAPPGSPTPWVRNTKDGNGVLVSAYVPQALARLAALRAARVQVTAPGAPTGVPAAAPAAAPAAGTVQVAGPGAPTGSAPLKVSTAQAAPPIPNENGLLSLGVPGVVPANQLAPAAPAAALPKLQRDYTTGAIVPYPGAPGFGIDPQGNPAEIPALKKRDVEWEPETGRRLLTDSRTHQILEAGPPVPKTPSGYRAPAGDPTKLERVPGGPADTNVIREEAAAKAAAEGKPEQQQFNQENALRDEFSKLTTDFRTVQTSYENIRNAAKAKDGASDMSLLYSYVKLLDPGSVVRESEFATAAASGSFTQRVQGAVERIKTGGRLPDDLRQEFVRESKNLYDAQLRSHDALASQYETLARRYGLAPEKVVTRFSRPQEGEKVKGGADVAPAGGGAKGGFAEGATAVNPQTGQRIVYRNGAWAPTVPTQ